MAPLHFSPTVQTAQVLHSQHHRRLFYSPIRIFWYSELPANWTYCQLSAKVQLLFPAIFFPPSPSNSQIQHPGILVFLLKAAMIALGQNYSVLFCSPNSTFTVGIILHIVVCSQSHSKIPMVPAALKIHNSLLTIMAVNHSIPQLT